ncbi:MFS transporter [Anopheles sinensis]|uniref:MFS transporter n=1 Tax=Anopheles sinensis TaxID=74873 RepID=A0A084VIB4_ANOSI|nr:MFS transporter [Anopheles sinensis]
MTTKSSGQRLESPYLNRSAAIDSSKLDLEANLSLPEPACGVEKGSGKGRRSCPASVRSIMQSPPGGTRQTRHASNLRIKEHLAPKGHVGRN